MNTPADPGAAALVSELGERGLIDRIRNRLPPSPPDLLVGPGDDAAVAKSERGGLQVLTTDALVEGVHFDFRYSTASDVGYKALAVNASDIAAMGGTPRLALLSLMLPVMTTVEVVDRLLDGFLELAGELRLALSGGNITRSPGPLIVDVTLVGSAKPRKVTTRAGGRPGDPLYVSGSIGSAAAGLGWLRARAASSGDPDNPLLAECVARHRRPEPRLRLGALLGRMRAASACMDLSDGLADAIRQIAGASGTGARIEAAAIPVHGGACEWFTSVGQDPLMAALQGGDDYELLFAVPARRKGRLRAVQRLLRGLTVTRIGELTTDRSVQLLVNDDVVQLPAGFSHF